MPPKKLKAFQPRHQKGHRIALHPPSHPVMPHQKKQKPSPLKQVETVTRENSPSDPVGVITVPETTANQVEAEATNTQPVEEFSGSIHDQLPEERLENVSSETSPLDNPSISTHHQLAVKLIEDVASDPSPLDDPNISSLQQSADEQAEGISATPLPLDHPAPVQSQEAPVIEAEGIFITPSPLEHRDPIGFQEAQVKEAEDFIFRLAEVCKVQTINNSNDVLSQTDSNIQGPAPALFTLFPKLNIHLRQRIWAFALPGEAYSHTKVPSFH
jgi:hypothetical protein